MMLGDDLPSQVRLCGYLWHDVLARVHADQLLHVLVLHDVLASRRDLLAKDLDLVRGARLGMLAEEPSLGRGQSMWRNHEGLMVIEVVKGVVQLHSQLELLHR